jgi:hypothetical protein
MGSAQPESQPVQEGNIAFPQRWNSLTRDGDYREVSFLMGDPDSGPMARVLSFPPGRESVRANGRAYSHHHRTDTFRITLASHSQQTRVSGRWLGQGEFVLRGANDVYVEKNGGHGSLLLLVSADRRGYLPVYSDHDRAEAEAGLDESASVVFGTEQPHFHEHDEDTASGLATTFANVDSKRPELYGTLHDQTNWHRMSDGSDVAMVLMGDPSSGTLVQMTQWPSKALEPAKSPSQTDRFWLLTGGSCSIGDRLYHAGDFRFLPAGTPEPEIVRGDAGSTEVVVISDRARWMESACAQDQNTRSAELAGLIKQQHEALHPMGTVVPSSGQQA